MQITRSYPSSPFPSLALDAFALLSKVTAKHPWCSIETSWWLAHLSGIGCLATGEMTNLVSLLPHSDSLKNCLVVVWDQIGITSAELLCKFVITIMITLHFVHYILKHIFNLID